MKTKIFVISVLVLVGLGVAGVSGYLASSSIASVNGARKITGSVQKKAEALQGMWVLERKFYLNKTTKEFEEEGFDLSFLEIEGKKICPYTREDPSSTLCSPTYPFTVKGNRLTFKRDGVQTVWKWSVKNGKLEVISTRSIKTELSNKIQKETFKDVYRKFTRGGKMVTSQVE